MFATSPSPLAGSCGVLKKGDHEQKFHGREQLLTMRGRSDISVLP
jgi:hypothetical protein